MPARFEWAFISGDAEALADLVTDDIVIDHALGYAEGKAEMAELDIPSSGLRHQMTNQVVFVDANGDAALLSCLSAPAVVAEQPTDASLPAIYANRTFDQLKLGDFVGVPERQAATLAQPAAVRGRQDRGDVRVR